MPFHYQDNWYFSRLEDGSVRITRVANHEEQEVLTIDADGWASIMSAVCAEGYVPGKWFQARDFHMEKPVMVFSRSKLQSAFDRAEQDTAEMFNQQTCSMADKHGNESCPICYFRHEAKRHLGLFDFSPETPDNHEVPVA